MSDSSYSDGGVQKMVKIINVCYGCPLDEISGFCALQWQEEVDEMSGNRKYKLANFDSEIEATEAGWTVTHRGQCAACSILQDLGVYISRNLTDETRRCGLEGTFLGMEQTFYNKNSKLRAKFLV